MNRVEVNPELLSWARERAGLDILELAHRFPRLPDWETRTHAPTLRQLEEFARAVHVPIGFLFLPAPPQEALPIPDFRTLAGRGITHPSPNLLDTLYLCQQRQDWYVEYSRLHGLPQVDFVGTAEAGQEPAAVASEMRIALALSAADRERLPTWTDALRHLIVKAEEAGVLVMASSVVGSNSHRKLDVEEFRGFALADELAPVVFLNAADSKAAQMFTLVHELAHLWLGASGISDPAAGDVPDQVLERWCNAVAAEVLIPLTELHERYRPHLQPAEQIQYLARAFKVSTLVALRRLFDARLITRDTLSYCYREELARVRSLDRGERGGGNFYRTLGARTGKRFARAVLSSTLEGQTLFQDAYRMLGIRKTSTFYEAARELEVML